MPLFSEEALPLRENPEVLDVVVVGAGFAGVYMLYKLVRDLGLKARAFETGDDVGGTWYWNRYPGARCDVQSIEYCYSFSREVAQEWNWTERYPSQPEIERYIQFVTDKLNLRSHITFKTRVTSMVFNEERNQWVIGTDTGEIVSARFVVTAVGCLSVPTLPRICGLEKFTGNSYQPGLWPKQTVDFSGRRVGVIGTGSSAIQIIPAIAEQGAEVFVFQRTPNHVLGGTNYPYSEEYLQRVKQRYDILWEKWRRHPNGLSCGLPVSSALDVTEEEREATYEACWSKGGFDILYAFDDLSIDQAANNTASEFLRRKVREIVKDPKIAEQLVPANHPLGSKRPGLEHGYYEAFNKPNVHLVSAEPIEAIETNGIRTSKSLYPLDDLILATGYDSITGALLRIDIRGRGGLSLRDEWANGAGTYLGLFMAGFPNLCVITGPGSPTVLTNMVRSIEQHVEWISDCLSHLSKNQVATIEATKEAQTGWMNMLETRTKLAGKMMTKATSSWYYGDNIEGKPRQFLLYIGWKDYQSEIDKVASDNYESLVLKPPPTTIKDKGSAANCV